MADYSFYGGKPGFSFIIVKSYKCIQPPNPDDEYFNKLIREDLIKEDNSLPSDLDIDSQISNNYTYRQKWLDQYCMVACFSKGPGYSAVHYEEHVLINTFNKNDSDNGKIFRRGYEYTDEMGGAVYVGTIVGPGGLAPDLSLTTKEEIEKLKDLSNQDAEHYTYRFGEGAYKPDEQNIIPGYNEETDTYNDDIEWHYCSIRDKNNEDTMVYIGFVIPYTVIDFTAESVDPYYNRSDDTENFINQNLTERADDKQHPYYEKWHFNIPKGIKGDTFQNFRIVDAASVSDTIQAYPGQDDDLTNVRKILVYDYYHFDKEEGGEPVTLYLGDYNMIEDIKVTDDGTIAIAYSHDDDQIIEKKVQWIKSITLDDNNGLFTVEYNNDAEPYTTNLRWVKDVVLTENGVLTFIYTHGDNTTAEVQLKWIDSISLDAEGTLTINYNTGDSEVFDRQLKWINDISLDANGTFTINYNNGTPPYIATLDWVSNFAIAPNGTISIIYPSGRTQELDQQLTWVQSASFTEDGKFNITFNRTDSNIQNINQNIKWIKNTYIQNRQDNNTTKPLYSGDQKIHIQYNDNTEAIIGEPLNYIVRMAVDNQYRLLVYYADPATRDGLSPTERISYNGFSDWHYLGNIKDENGILLGLNVTYEDIEAGMTDTTFTIQKAIQYLNSNYPSGLTGTNLEGKIASVGTDLGEKIFFAFDYVKQSWYYLGELSVSADNFTMVAPESDPDNLKASLALGGVWYVLED